MKKEKKVFKKWGKDITPDHAWDMGEMMGARNVFKFLAGDDTIDKKKAEKRADDMPFVVPVKMMGVRNAFKFLAEDDTIDKKKAEKRADDMPFVVPVNMTVDDFLAQWNSCHPKKEQYVRSKGQLNLKGK